MEMNDIIKQSPAELGKLLADKREALRVWRFGLVGSKSKNMKEGMATKKDIARILTVINTKTKPASTRADALSTRGG